MATRLGTAFIELVTKDDQLDKGLNSAKAKVNGFLRDIATGISQGIGQALAQSIGALVRAGVDQIGKATEAAANFNREVRRTGVIFGESQEAIRSWASTASTSLGLTETAALRAANGLGNLFVQMGASREEAATLSKQMVEAARDVAAFNGVAGGAETVLETFAAAFRGEYDSLQRYIPAISDAAIKQQALADSGKETAEQLTAAEKALATQTLILNGAALAAGSYANSLETAEGQQDRFVRRIEDGLARVGQVFAPIKRVFFEGLNELVDLVAPYGENILDSFAAGLARGIVALTPVLAQLRSAFVYWLQPGSPPRLLPELTEWGQSAMQEYLRGWTLADFDALREVQGIIESVVRSFARTGDIKDTDLVSRIFGTTRTIQNAIREFRQLGQVSEATLGSIADAAGPAGTEVAGLVREYFNLEQASRRVKIAQDDLNGVVKRYADALDPINRQLQGIRDRQREIEDEQTLEELGDILRDPRAEASERELARLRIEEIRLEQQQRAIEEERDTAVDAAQAKIDAAQKEADAQRERFGIFQAALEQQTQTNALIGEEIDLRTRLANEAMAAEEKRLRDLEQAAREHAATLERIADAQLRYRLATTDTEGQLALLRQELGKVQEGSAEYYDILRQIAGLEKRLADERAGGDGLLLGLEGGSTSQQAQAATGGLKALEEALRGAFDALKGEGPQAQLNPILKDVIDTIGQIDDVVREAMPFLQGFIDLLTGKSSGISEGTGDPFAGSFWFEGLIPGLRSTIVTLEQLLTGDWAGLWGRFKGYVASVLGDPTLQQNDPRTYGFYTWLQDTAIPAFETLLTTDWATLWSDFSTTIKDAWQTAVDYADERIAELTTAIEELKTAWQGVVDYVQARIAELQAAVQETIDLWDRLRGIQPDAPFGGAPGGGGGGGGGGDFSSFPGGFPGVAPLTPALASAGGTVNHNETFYIEQVITTGDDIGGARAGAEAGFNRIRDDLLNRRLNG